MVHNLTKAVDKHLHYVQTLVSLSVFGGVLYWAGADQCPLYRVERWSLLGGSNV